jgi:hypothetical protein
MDWDAESPVPLCGAASLVARGLARLEGGDSLIPIDEISSLIDTITKATAWVQIGFARESSIGGVQVFDAGGKRVEAAAQPFGTFAFTLTDASVPLARAAGEAISTFLATEEAGAAFMKTGAAGNDGPDGLAVRRAESGAIELAFGDPDAAQIREVSLAEAVAAVEQYVAA